ncbi:MAG: cupin domain-containing protein [Actinomycetota bacterium]|nr:cupin domain-containing protein [Actinomycetota bacterium]
MSYPPVRYTGAGQASATFRSGAQPPELPFAAGGAASYLATQASTGGEYGLFRWDMGASPGGPDPHFHRAISEAFYVLRGTVQLHDGRRWLDAVPGDFLYVPPGGVHAFRNESGPASMLMLFAPGAPREGYFEELEALPDETRSRMTEQDWTELYARHDQVMVAPRR